MISPDECRALDPTLATLSDDELAEAVSLLDRLAEVFLADWFTRQRDGGASLPSEVVTFLEKSLA